MARLRLYIRVTLLLTYHPPKYHSIFCRDRQYRKAPSAGEQREAGAEDSAEGALRLRRAPYALPRSRAPHRPSADRSSSRPRETARRSGVGAILRRDEADDRGR